MVWAYIYSKSKMGVGGGGGIYKLGKVDDNVPVLQLPRFKSNKQKKGEIQIEKDGLKVGLSPSKKISDLLQWKPSKNDEKCLLFHLEGNFRSQDI